MNPFRPQMTTRIAGFSVATLKTRSFDGVAADLWQVRCAATAGGDYVGRDPRIVVVLEAHGGGAFDFETAAGRTRQRFGNRPLISFVPADLPMTGTVVGLTGLRHLDIHFDLAALRRRFGAALDPEQLETPRVMFDDDRTAALARLIAAEIDSDRPLDDLYGESLFTALIAGLFEVAAPPARRRSSLPDRTLRRVCAFIEENCARPIRIEELAAIAGLSPSHFGHAFKAAAGVAPHQWQLAARVRRAQAMLRQPSASLVDIAAATGFCDQPHFTRVFRRIVGVTPRVWLRETAGRC
ncbi:helix-turn-helix domain-containing protein [Methylobrevis albus]|nr:AraC family transcriptional regulator [Methylobrevis albus]